MLYASFPAEKSFCETVVDSAGMSVNLEDGKVLFSKRSLETGLYVVSMLCVGFLEEVIFRGLLFKALWADAENVGWAVLLSSLTFGMGHIVNLLNGAQLLPTLLQICYATAIGFLFTVLFLRSGTLLPCILTHSAVNSLSAFAVERTGALDIAAAAVLTAVSLAYALWILRRSARP